MTANRFDTRQGEHKSSTLSRLSSASVPRMDSLFNSIHSELTPPLALSASSTPNLIVNVGAAVVSNAVTGINHTLTTVGANAPAVAASTITFSWSANTITATPSLGVATNASMGTSAYIKALVYLDGNDQVSVLFGTENAVEASADTLAPPSGVLPIGYITLRTISSVLQNITNSKIYQYAGAGGGSGAGSGSPLDPDQESNYAFYARSDFAVDKKLFFGSVSGATDQVLGLGRIKFTNSGQSFTSSNLVGNQFRAEGLTINRALIKLLYENSYVETPTIEITRDGGATWSNTTEVLIASQGNTVTADYSWSGTDTLTGGTLSSAQSAINRIAAIITPAYDQILNSFDFYCTSSSVTGTATAFLYDVSTGVPSSLRATASETKNLGTDINGSAGYKNFSFSTGQALTAGTQYALIVQTNSASPAANLVGYATTSSASWNTSGATHNGTTWSANAIKYAVKLYSSGCDLRVRVTTSAGGATDKRLKGFGVDFVWQGGFVTTGIANWEQRTITSTEASTGLITLAGVTYTPGTNQLIAYSQNHVYTPIDFIELSPSQVQFTPAALTTGDVIRFVVGFGMVDGSSVALSRFNSLYDAVVGTSADVAAGNANYTSLQTAINAMSTGAKILVLDGTYTENISVDREINITGKGRSTVISGTWTNTNTSDYSIIENLKITGNITFNSGADGIFFRQIFQGSGGIITDNGLANSKLVIVE